MVHVWQYAAAWTLPGVQVAGPPDPGEDEVLDQVRTYLEDRADRPVMEYLGLQGTPAAVLPELGATAQLLVLGSRGRGGFAGLLLGSNGMAAARDAGCPVVVVPRPGREVHGDAPAEPGTRVVIGLRVDSPDETTLAFAEAALRGARLQVVAAYPRPPHAWASAGELVPPVVDQDAVENETRVLTEALLAPHHKDHPDVRTEPCIAPGDFPERVVAHGQSNCSCRRSSVPHRPRRLRSTGRYAFPDKRAAAPSESVR